MTGAQHERVVIVGGGPAGLSAAVQLRREGLDPLLLEAGRPGGLLRNADRVENYLGFPDGIPGSELADLFLAQARRWGVRILAAEAAAVVYHGGVFEIAALPLSLTADYLVVASGTEAKLWTGPSFLGIDPALIPAEVISIGDTRDLRIAIVGGGDAAFDYALNLARANNVILIHRGVRPAGLALLAARAAQNPGIQIWPEAEIQVLERTPEGCFRLRIRRSEKETQLEVDHVLAAVGRRPRLGFLEIPSALQSELDEAGRFFLAGDAAGGRERQTAIAAGDGLRAAMRITLRCRGEVK